MSVCACVQLLFRTESVCGFVNVTWIYYSPNKLHAICKYVYAESKILSRLLKCN